VALDRILAEKGLELDAAIELKVNPGMLYERIAKRNAEAQARGETLRSDDDPEVLKRRLEAYRDQTAPLVDYYRWRSALKTVDGMAPIGAGASAIGGALSGMTAGTPAADRGGAKTAARATAKKAAAKTAGGKKTEPVRVTKLPARKTAKAAKPKATSPEAAAATGARRKSASGTRRSAAGG